LRESKSIEFWYRLKRPTDFDLPGRRRTQLVKASISTDAKIEWMSQVVQLDATAAIYNYVNGRIQMSGPTASVIRGVNWNTATPMAEPPPLEAVVAVGLQPGELDVSLAYFQHTPIGAKGSPDIDALVEPADLASDPSPLVPVRRQP
jgi:hypothetical protein